MTSGSDSPEQRAATDAAAAIPGSSERLVVIVPHWPPAGFAEATSATSGTAPPAEGRPTGGQNDADATLPIISTALATAPTEVEVAAPPATDAAGQGSAVVAEEGWHLIGKPGPLTGFRLDDYDVGTILGQGAMGTVYRARQVSLRRRVALKVLPAAMEGNQRMRMRFELEARIASTLSTPHVVQVYSAGVTGATTYFAMEYIDGSDLARTIAARAEERRPFSAQEAAGYIIQAAHGLAEARRRDVVHRDIKPSNLMVTSTGMVKIADFGISKIVGEHHLTLTGTTVGTPAYCSPEQGRGRAVDHRSDIYSLGVVFYELLTLKKPFVGTAPDAVIYQHCYQEPELITRLRPGLPAVYQAICMKCLMKDPAQRYQEAAALAADLERAGDATAPLFVAFEPGFGTGAKEEMHKYLGIRSHRWLWLAVAALLAVLVGGGLWYWAMAAERWHLLEQSAAEVARHKEGLRSLDAARLVPSSAGDDLAWLEEHVPGDADAARWQGKLRKVAELSERLRRSEDMEPAAALRASVAKDVQALSALVGAEAPEVARWRSILAGVDETVKNLRRELGQELDGAQDPGARTRERVGPQLLRFARLAGEQDADAIRWRKRLRVAEEEMAALRSRLMALDDEAHPVGETQAKALQADAAKLAALVDATDPALQRWSRRLEDLREEMRNLRATLGTQLEGEGILTLNQQVAVQPYLDRYRARVESGDHQLTAWTRRLADAAAKVQALRTLLARRLAGDAPVPMIDLEDLDRTLDEYRKLVAADDGELAAWSVRLRREHALIEADRGTCAEFERPGPEVHPPVAVRMACAQAILRLDQRAAITADRKGMLQRRIADEQAYEETLRRELAELGRDRTSALSAEAGRKLQALEAMAGRQDGEVADWHQRFDRVLALRAALAPLDGANPLPESCRAKLAAYVALAGEDDAARGWKAKLARVERLEEALAGLDRVQPLPPDALANAQELVERQLGPQDRIAAAWLDKVQRVLSLRQALSGWFGLRPGCNLLSNYVLPAGAEAIATVEELKQLTGEEEPEVRHWSYRAHVLSGPPRPWWAANCGRDGCGLYADLAVGAVQQRLRYVPAGMFTIGSPAEEPGRRDNEAQVADIVVSHGFWLADSECTQALWREVMGHDPSRFATADGQRPVERVSLDDVNAFLAALPRHLPEGPLRPFLPSEAEWEYACRAGVEGPYNVEDKELDRLAWFGRSQGTCEVRRLAPNRLGLFDMHGNVWEWCRDRYGTYSAAETIDPEGRQERDQVVRGGGWADPAPALRSARRVALARELRSLYVGFRFAIAVEWPEGKEPQRPSSGH